MPATKAKSKAKKRELTSEEVAAGSSANANAKRRDMRQVLGQASKAGRYMRMRKKRMAQTEPTAAREKLAAWETMMTSFAELEIEIRRQSEKNTIARPLYNKFSTMFGCGRELLTVLRDSVSDEDKQLKYLEDVTDQAAMCVRNIRNNMTRRLMDVPYVRTSSAQPMATLVSEVGSTFSKSGSKRGMERRKEQDRLNTVLTGNEVEKK